MKISIEKKKTYFRYFYFIIGIFFTRKFKSAKNKHKYAILIAARNEEEVIGNLLDSIKKQDYPGDLITTFVVADNCTDKTATIVLTVAKAKQSDIVDATVEDTSNEAQVQ